MIPKTPPPQKDHVGRTELEVFTEEQRTLLRRSTREYVRLVNLCAACKIVGSPLRRSRFVRQKARKYADLVRRTVTVRELEAAVRDTEGDLRAQQDYLESYRSMLHDSVRSRQANRTAGNNQHAGERLSTSQQLSESRKISAREQRTRNKQLVEKYGHLVNDSPDGAAEFEDEAQAMLFVLREVKNLREERANLLEELSKTRVSPGRRAKQQHRALRQWIKRIEDDLEALASLAPGERASTGAWSQGGRPSEQSKI